jgi:uncharacterized protein (TIGR00369 family)
MSERERSYRWHDPRAAWSRLGKVSGVDYLKAVIDGEVPPPPVAIANRLRLVEVAEGRVVYKGQPGEDHANDVGSVQGGWIASLLDAAIGSAVHSALPAGVSYATLELKVNYVRGVMPDAGELTCEAKTEHVGRRIATASARVTDDDGKLYAHATTTCMIVPAE